MKKTNPIVRETKLYTAAGWVVRQYADGHYDATNGVGLSPGFRSFTQAQTYATLAAKYRG